VNDVSVKMNGLETTLLLLLLLLLLLWHHCQS